MNVGFFVGNLQRNGGIGRVVSIVANRLCEEKGYQVHMISHFQKGDKLLYELASSVHTHSLYNAPISMIKAMLFKNAVGKLKKIIEDEKIDVIVACGALFYPLAILAAKAKKIRCICWEHINPATVSDYKFQGVARKYAVKKADDIVVLTKSAEVYYRDHFKLPENRLTQIYNPVSTGSGRSVEYLVSSKKIISVGRLSYQKNFSLLIDVAADVLPKYPEWTWDIFGSGEEFDALSQKIKEKGLEGRVNLLGQVSDLYDRYGDYAFQVMTSRYEGFPMSLIEGMANRLPLISFDIETGPDEIIKEGENGFLVPPEDRETMAERICRLIEAPELRKEFSEASYALRTKYDLESIVLQWKELL